MFVCLLCLSTFVVLTPPSFFVCSFPQLGTGAISKQRWMETWANPQKVSLVLRCLAPGAAYIAGKESKKPCGVRWCHASLDVCKRSSTSPEVPCERHPAGCCAAPNVEVALSLVQLEEGLRWPPCGAPESIEARSCPGSCDVADWRPLRSRRLLEVGGARSAPGPIPNTLNCV